MGQVLLVRHGQASFGAANYDELSELGWAQGRVLGTWLASTDVIPDLVITGGMKRHHETADAVMDAAGWADTRIEVDAGWAEFDHLQVIAALPDAPSVALEDRRGFQLVFEGATARWTAGQNDGDYSGSFMRFTNRVGAALDHACDRPGTVIVITSGGPIAAACAGLVVAGGPPTHDLLPTLWRHFNTVQVNAGVTRVLVGATGRRLLTFNEHAHLTRVSMSYR